MISHWFQLGYCVTGVADLRTWLRMIMNKQRRVLKIVVNKQLFNWRRKLSSRNWEKISRNNNNSYTVVKNHKRMIWLFLYDGHCKLSNSIVYGTDYITAPLRQYLKFLALNISENQRHRRLTKKKNPNPSGIFASVQLYVIQSDVSKICQHYRFRSTC